MEKKNYYHYTSYVVDAVIDYFHEQGVELTKTDVKLMPRHDVLKAFLEWEGIIGYTGLLENIFECEVEEIIW